MEESEESDNKLEGGLKFFLSDELRGLDEQELNSDARLVVGVLQELLKELGLSLTNLLMESSLFSISFLRIAEFSKVTLILELDLIKGVSKLESFSNK